MKRYTLLELVQEVSRAIGDKERHGLDEDLRVHDVANICIATLESMCSRRDWEFLKDRVVIGSTVTNRTTVALPTTVARIQQVSYRVGTTLTNITYLDPAQFLTLVNEGANMEQVTAPGGASIYVGNKQPPKYYTQFDERSITLDSYDSNTEVTGLVSANLVMRAEVYLDTTGAREVGLPVADWEPNIPTQLFALWLQESIVACSSQIVGAVDQAAVRDARRIYTQLLQLEPVTGRDDVNRRINYGRRYRH